MLDCSELQQAKLSIRAWIQKGKLTKAKRLIEKSCVSNNQDAELWALAAHVHTNLRDYDSAITDYRHAIELGPPNPDYYNNLGYLLQGLGKTAEAVTSFKEALAVNKSNIGATFNLASAYATIGDLGNAEACYRATLKLQPDLVDAHINLGNVLRKLKRAEEAILAYKTAIKFGPTSFLAKFNLAGLLEKMHRLEDARHYAESACKLKPDSHAAVLTLARINRRAGYLCEARELLEKFISCAEQPVDQAQLHNELGRTLEGLERYDDAYIYFSRANQAWSEFIAHQHVDTDAYENRISCYTSLLEKVDRANWGMRPPANDNDKSPVFLVGFPRSGTTLTEQLLAAHPRFESSDEHPLIQQVISSIPDIVRPEKAYPASVPELSQSDCEKLVHRYWQLVKSFAGEQFEGKRFIDKVPLNIVDLGLIYRLFPNASVIVVIRDPRDVCLSCFTQSFAPNQAMAHFLDIRSTASLYNAVMTLWNKYRETLPIRWLEVRYEDVVADTPAATRHMIEFLGEEWDESVLRFFTKARQRYIATPSYEGVARPVYSSAIGKWRNYESSLQPVMPVLQPFIKQFGYF